LASGLNEPVLTPVSVPAYQQEEISMKVTARGWGRNMGDNVIADVDLAEASVSRDPNRRISFDKDPTVFRTGEGVNIDWGKRVNLGGRYRWEVELTTDEIIYLFRMKVGAVLDVDLLEHHGFSVSEELQKKMLSSIKLADLTIGDLAKLGAAAPSEQPEPAPIPKINPFRGRL
jgi:hypothetical protein